MRRRRYRIIWSQTAAGEMEAAVDYLVEHNRQAARSFLNALQDQLARVQRFPRSGRVVPELEQEDIREAFAGTYRVVYRLNEARAQIQILAFIHAARLLPGGVQERGGDSE